MPCNSGNGGGIQGRSRTVRVQPAFGGKACPSLSEERRCHTHTCAQDCEVSDWSSWGACSANCGGGEQTQTRQIVTPAAHGGKSCPVVSRNRACNTHACDAACQVSEWSAWDACDKFCGGGYQRATRSIVKAAVGHGAACPVLTRERACNEHACARTCEVSAWSAWGTCSAACGTSGQQERYRTVFSFPSEGAPACPVLTESRPCNRLACPVDCQVSTFTWGACSAVCNGGTQVGTRAVVVAATQGGQACPALTRVQPCNVHACPDWAAAPHAPRTPVIPGGRLWQDSPVAATISYESRAGRAPVPFFQEKMVPGDVTTGAQHIWWAQHNPEAYARRQVRGFVEMESHEEIEDDD
jgi:hypothetical protein